MQPISDNFFYSNLFIAIVTFIVGTFGVYLYYRQQRDKKKRLAKIILLEIENAQDKLKEAKSKVLQNPDDLLPEHLYAMPTNSWSESKHLFVKDFTHTEWRSINEFYDLCEIFDDAIRHNDARFALQEAEVRKNVHQATYQYTIDLSEKLLAATSDQGKEQAVNEFFKKRDSAINLLTDAKYIHIYTPTKQNMIVKDCLYNVDVNLSLSTVGAKLEKLSKYRLKFF